MYCTKLICCFLPPCQPQFSPGIQKFFLEIFNNSADENTKTASLYVWEFKRKYMHLHIDSTFSTSLFSFVDVHHKKKIAKKWVTSSFSFSFLLSSRCDLKRGPFSAAFLLLHFDRDELETLFSEAYNNFQQTHCGFSVMIICSDRFVVKAKVFFSLLGDAHNSFLFAESRKHEKTTHDIIIKACMTDIELALSSTHSNAFE